MDGWPFILGLFLMGEQEGSGEGEAPENIMFQKSSLFVLRGEQEGGGGEGEAPEKIRFQKSCVFVRRMIGTSFPFLSNLYEGAVSVEGIERSMRMDYIMKIMGLDICVPIKVGDAIRKGISGDKKKRPTIDWGAMVDEWISATKATITIRRKDQPQRLESYG